MVLLRLAQSFMNNDFSTIWEWLYGHSKQPERAAVQPDPSPQPESPVHRIDDSTLLALEREAEVAVKLWAAGEPDPVSG
jgi:hypothetical protein